MASRSRWAWLRDYLPVPRLMLLAALTVAAIVTRVTAQTIDLGPAAVPVGLVAVAGGLALIAWALWTLDVGMLGGVETLAPSLVEIGPYRWIRHPVYVGMIVALIGYGVAAASWPGLAATVLLVLPAAVYRAGREEAALARTFPAAWAGYRGRTGAWLPGSHRS